jgi:hypothetical protein
MRSVPIQTYTQDDVDEEEGVTTDVIDAANATIRRRYFMRCAADCPGRGRNALTNIFPVDRAIDDGPSVAAPASRLRRPVPRPYPTKCPLGRDPDRGLAPWRG